MTHTAAPTAPVTPLRMRRALAGSPTGTAVVAAEVDRRGVGLSADSFTSVSLDPPLVSVSFAHSSTSWPQLRRAARWGISVLGERHADTLHDLRRPSRERFGGIDVGVVAGAAFVQGALATLTVELVTEIPAGDHVLTLLRVLDLSRDDAQRPPVFFDSGARRLAD
ncbi:NADH-FMN oxidoreductase RutF, flavin reductase (DIM6/NTAB) family [Geodermatophilus amargosae]|uniref:NADH-FMN oxidoreductase RutF, flavin reductase (DIM6/NTAB) family n=1 Tax=Geodermatophilus amargosae TaxID=1296565 RepID=A0A1I7B4E4_9ACTN|nr:flavin reductase family protein [Geodermatophilus amargosae]SFT82083.1 NADH-FMN oxidoreductase RutF, flavin reductase (DIM6/NTAB) family [Geodermatophilus amargosae]